MKPEKSPSRKSKLLSLQQMVRREFPKASCYSDGAGFAIMANNGSGNVLGSSETSEFDAWTLAARGTLGRRDGRGD